MLQDSTHERVLCLFPKLYNEKLKTPYTLVKISACRCLRFVAGVAPFIAMSQMFERGKSCTYWHGMYTKKILVFP